MPGPRNKRKRQVVSPVLDQLKRSILPPWHDVDMSAAMWSWWMQWEWFRNVGFAGGVRGREAPDCRVDVGDGASVALVAPANGVTANRLFKWRRALERGELIEVPTALLPVALSRFKRDAGCRNNT